MTARSVCAEPGCWRPAVARGRCRAHQPVKSRPGSTRRWRKIRAQVLARDRHRCQLCGAPAQHVDHVRRVADGGSDDLGNLRALCSACNLGRVP